MLRTGLVGLVLLPAMLCPSRPLLAAGSDQHIVRVIWKVGEGSACARRRPFLESDRFELPEVIDAVRCPDGYESVGKAPIVRRGDLVRIYAVRYNPVSFTTLEPETLTLEPKEPAALSILIELARILRGGAPEAATLSALQQVARGQACRFGGRDVPDPFSSAEKCLQDVLTGIAEVDESIDVTAAPYVAVAKTLHGVVSSAPLQLSHSDNPHDDLLRSLDHAVAPVRLGNFQDFAMRLDKDLTVLADMMAGVLARVILFDKSWAELCDREDCSKHEAIRKRRETVRELVPIVLGKLVHDDKAPFNQDTARAFRDVAADVKAASEDLDRLSDESARKYAVLISPDVPTKQRSTVVAILTLQLRDEASPFHVQRVLALPVASEHPLLLASVGLGAVHKAGKGFDYKKLAVVQDVSGTPPAIVESLDVVDDDESINSFPPIIWTHVRLKEALYASVGTTPDHNIFDNVFVGLSYHRAEWRSLFTAGAVRAKGAYEEDVRAAAERFAPDGTPLPNLDLDKVSIGADWHWRFFVAWSVHPF